MVTAREIETGMKRATKTICVDLAGAGGACHEYRVIPMESKPGMALSFAKMSFQSGPIKENGVNGCQNEDLLAIVADRLRYFQSGPFSCRENAVALTKIEEALLWLNKRTSDRIARNVEGKSVK